MLCEVRVALRDIVLHRAFRHAAIELICKRDAGFSADLGVDQPVIAGAGFGRGKVGHAPDQRNPAGGRIYGVVTGSCVWTLSKNFLAYEPLLTVGR